MEFFTSGINPPPSTPLCLSPMLSPEKNTSPTLPALDISVEDKVAPSSDIDIVVYNGMKRDHFPPRGDITASLSIPRGAVSTYSDLVAAIEARLRVSSEFTILLPSGLQVHPSSWDSRVAAEGLIYIRFSPTLLMPTTYTLTPQRFVKLAINGLWADSYDQAPQEISVVCKSGTHLTVADIHGQAVDAVNRIVTQCRYAVEAKGGTLIGLKMAVDGKGEIGLEEETNELFWDDAIEVQCTAIWE